jgi:hypothetical protein
MSAILNGFYFLCAYTQKTCLQPNDAGAGSPLYAWEYSGNTEQKVSMVCSLTALSGILFPIYKTMKYLRPYVRSGTSLRARCREDT